MCPHAVGHTGGRGPGDDVRLEARPSPQGLGHLCDQVTVHTDRAGSSQPVTWQGGAGGFQPVTWQEVLTRR